MCAQASVCANTCMRACMRACEGGRRGMLVRVVCAVCVFFMSDICFCFFYEMCSVLFVRFAGSFLSLGCISVGTVFDIPTFASFLSDCLSSVLCAQLRRGRLVG